MLLVLVENEIDIFIIGCKILWKLRLQLFHVNNFSQEWSFVTFVLCHINKFIKIWQTYLWIYLRWRRSDAFVSRRWCQPCTISFFHMRPITAKMLKVTICRNNAKKRFKLLLLFSVAKRKFPETSIKVYLQTGWVLQTRIHIKDAYFPVRLAFYYNVGWFNQNDMIIPITWLKWIFTSFLI